MEKAEKVEKEGTETAEKSAQTPEVYEDNFAVDNKAAKEFAEKVKDAAARKDLEALADLTAFPVYVGLPDAGVVGTREDFLKLGADAVLKDELLESIERADIDNFQPSMAGFSISDGRNPGYSHSARRQVFFYDEGDSALYATKMEEVVTYILELEPWEQVDACVFNRGMEWVLAITHEDMLLFLEETAK